MLKRDFMGKLSAWEAHRTDAIASHSSMRRTGVTRLVGVSSSATADFYGFIADRPHNISYFS